MEGRKVSYRFITTLLLIILIIVMSLDYSFAQCPMCKMSAESNLQNGGTEGRGLNAGILYMLSLPYLLVSVIGYIWWKRKKREEASK